MSNQNETFAIGDRVKERVAWQSYGETIAGTIVQITRMIDNTPPGTAYDDFSHYRFEEVKSAGAYDETCSIRVRWDAPDDIPFYLCLGNHECFSGSARSWVREDA